MSEWERRERSPHSKRRAVSTMDSAHYTNPFLITECVQCAADLVQYNNSPPSPPPPPHLGWNIQYVVCSDQR